MVVLHPVLDFADSLFFLFKDMNPFQHPYHCQKHPGRKRWFKYQHQHQCDAENIQSDPEIKEKCYLIYIVCNQAVPENKDRCSQEYQYKLI